MTYGYKVTWQDLRHWQAFAHQRKPKPTTEFFTEEREAIARKDILKDMGMIACVLPAKDIRQPLARRQSALKNPGGLPFNASWKLTR